MIVPQAAPRLSRTPGLAAAKAPLPGQDSRAVLADLGVSEGEVDALTGDGVVG